MLERAPPAPQPAAALLAADDPPAFEILNPDGRAPLLLICDHASRAVPARLGGLGLEAAAMDRHIAWDIGAADVARHLSAELDAAAVLAGYSRLVIDVNRAPGDPQSIPEVSDGTAIPGNRDLSEADQIERVEALFEPYHQAVTGALAHLWRRGVPPALLSVHTFTPDMAGEQRDWDIGVLWNRDFRLALPLIERLRACDDLHVGDNQPYSGRDVAFSIDLHGGAAGLANCAVEIRQDQVANAADARRWSAILAPAMAEVLAMDGVHRVEHF